MYDKLKEIAAAEGATAFGTAHVEDLTRTKTGTGRPVSKS